MVFQSFLKDFPKPFLRGWLHEGLDFAGPRNRVHKKGDMLRAVQEQERGRVALDLKDVLLVDGEAVKLLAFQDRTEPNSETA